MSQISHSLLEISHVGPDGCRDVAFFYSGTPELGGAFDYECVYYPDGSQPESLEDIQCASCLLALHMNPTIKVPEEMKN